MVSDPCRLRKLISQHLVTVLPGPNLMQLAPVLAIEDGWAGDDSRAPSRELKELARSLADELPIVHEVGPSEDGEIDFVWNLPRGSIYLTLSEDAADWSFLPYNSKSEREMEREKVPLDTKEPARVLKAGQRFFSV
mgnify:FL=1